MTTRQAVLASVVDSSHVALTDEGSSKKKKVLNESELALRREETARKRKNLSEKKLEDEKAETINRLLKKQSRPKNKRQTAISSTEDRTPNPPGTKARPSDDEEMQGEADEVVEDLYVPPPDPVVYRWISTTRTPGSIGDERPGDSEAMQGVEGASASSSSAEKKTFITFSVPNCVLYPNGREEEGAGHVAMGADGASKTATVGAVPRLKVVSPAVQKEKSRCAIPDCGKERKYRLVKDWQIGACGMEHLKVLEAK
ncbi:hypothetical protein BDN72DRAFT_870675 [Pluteus cervinus]|uniref:Uncharacterized protein n=1 Tax=Pluteus cervinus TaxID=181527 RepID=A0ACD3ATP5_9AGAR|nr:hypothetical protein BDN72DRAFT_870675 [Pluteus cervinus]